MSTTRCCMHRLHRFRTGIDIPVSLYFGRADNAPMAQGIRGKPVIARLVASALGYTPPGLHEQDTCWSRRRSYVGSFVPIRIRDPLGAEGFGGRQSKYGATETLVHGCTDCGMDAPNV